MSTRIIFEDKKYAIGVIVSILIMIIGAMLTPIFSMIEPPNYSDPGFESYYEMLQNIGAISQILNLLSFAGILIFLFIGAITDDDIPDASRRGMFVAIGFIILGFGIYSGFTSFLSMF